MLEQLQHLQNQIKILVQHISTLDDEIARKDDHHQEYKQQLEQQLQHYQSTSSEHLDQLTKTNHSFSALSTGYETLENEHQNLTEKYHRLENSCAELRKRFEALILQKNQLKTDTETLSSQNESLQQQIKELTQQRDQLYKKNEQAKQKVEAIIQRLAILGTSQDAYAQEIQQLAHPHVEEGTLND